MLTKENIASLLQDLKSDRIERTISFREDKPGPAVCYLSNNFAGHKKPGYILSGVEDDCKGANMKIGNAELQNIGNVKTNGNVLPQPSIAVSNSKTSTSVETIQLLNHFF